jgi:hypothetical protein
MVTTRQRRDKSGTEFGDWIRQQHEIDSSLGYLATNIDYMWHNYKTGKWLYIEEKRYNAKPKFWQAKMFKTMHDTATNDPMYQGFHLLVFEQTSPDDGYIKLNGKVITREDLIEFLRFEKANDWYKGLF